MNIILKQILELGTNVVTMPAEAKILCVQEQYGKPVLYFQVEDKGVFSYEDRTFLLIGTGHQFDSSDCNYIGTVMLMNGQLVIHIYEKVS